MGFGVASWVISARIIAEKRVIHHLYNLHTKTMSLYYGYILPFTAVESLGFGSTELAEFVGDHGLQYHMRLYQCSVCGETIYRHYAGLNLRPEIHGLTEIIDTVDDPLVHTNVQNFLTSLRLESREPVAGYNEDNWAMMIVTVQSHRHTHECDNCIGEQVDIIAENYQNQLGGPP